MGSDTGIDDLLSGNGSLCACPRAVLPGQQVALRLELLTIEGDAISPGRQGGSAARGSAGRTNSKAQSGQGKRKSDKVKLKGSNAPGN